MSTLMVLALLAIFIICIMKVRSEGLAPNVTTFDKGWTLTYNGQTTEIGSFSEYTVPFKVKKGDSLFFESDVPEDAPVRPVMRLRSYHNAVAIYENGILLYSYDTNQTKMNFIGSGLHHVFLSPEIKKRHVKIAFIEQVDGRLVTVAAPDLVPMQYALSDFASHHVFTLIVGVFLVLFGMLTILISALTRFYKISYYRSLMIGILSLSLGTWTLCYTKVIQMVSYNFGFNTTLEYFCLYFSTIPFTFLLWRMHREQLGRVKNACFVLLIIYEILFTWMTAYLHITNMVYYPRTLSTFCASVLIAFIFFAVSGVLYNKKMDMAGKILTQGIVIFALTACIDLVRYNLFRLLSIGSPLMETTWLPLGTLIFVMLLVQSYVMHLFVILEDRAEKSYLATMAYLDALTGLYNRAKSQQVFESLDGSADDYVIVSVDLNGLKIVNDNYGHSAGDNFIKAFADILKDAFARIGTAIRVGGDEFLAIVRKEHVAEVDSALARMDKLEKIRSSEMPVPLEAAYGIAYRHELAEANDGAGEKAKVEAEKVYRLADERMYAMKASMKSDLVRR